MLLRPAQLLRFDWVPQRDGLALKRAADPLSRALGVLGTKAGADMADVLDSLNG